MNWCARLTGLFGVALALMVAAGSMRDAQSELCETTRPIPVVIASAKNFRRCIVSLEH